MAVFKKKFSVV